MPVGRHPQPGQPGLQGLDVELQPTDAGAFMLNSRSSLRPSSTPRICQESSMSPSRSDPGWCAPGPGPGRRSDDPSIRAPPTARSCRSSAARPQLLQHLPPPRGGEGNPPPAGGAVVEAVFGMAPAQTKGRLLPVLLGTEPLLQRQALRQRLIEAEQMLGQQGRKGPSSAGMSCLRPPPAPWRWVGEPRWRTAATRRRAGAQKGDRNDGAAFADMGGEFLSCCW